MTLPPHNLPSSVCVCVCRQVKRAMPVCCAANKLYLLSCLLHICSTTRCYEALVHDKHGSDLHSLPKRSTPAHR